MRNSFYFIMAIALLIVCLGILSIYSSNYQKEGQFWQDIYKRQVLWVLIGLVFFVLLSNVNYRWLWDWTYVLYICTVAILLLVCILGAIRLGAQRWLRIAWFNFQPSEFAKVVVVIFLARYFSHKSIHQTSLLSSQHGILRGVIVPFAFIAIPMALIIEQPDLGSGMILFAVFLAMLYGAGIRMRYLAAVLAAIILPMPLFWHFLRDYQRQRLLVFLNPNIDPLGAGYTVIQSKIAIGSGWLFGKGWLSGTQGQLHFLPESHTDFIFATFAEEWGFLGCGVLIAGYFFIIRQGLRIAQRTSDEFGRLLALGITMLLAIQVLVNVAMNMGFAPVVGIPLPLMSYGGSSVLVTFISLGILVSIDRRRSVF